MYDQGTRVFVEPGLSVAGFMPAMQGLGSPQGTVFLIVRAGVLSNARLYRKPTLTTEPPACAV
jgi:hypothetical protein